MRRLGTLLFAVVALLAACGSDDDGQVADSGGDTGAAFNEADVAFAQGMIPHHRQAVEMAALAEDRAESDEVKDLATRIEAAQDPEIETLQGWLEDWGEPVEADGDMGGMDDGDMGGMDDGDMGGMDDGDMGGMMSDDDMMMLEDAEGSAFDQQFLEMMAAHHRGAIEMAQTELDEGEFPEALTMAEEIIETQTAEIAEIEELLAG